MSFLRSIVSDLVEKRLWPIAVALVVGVVAVPLVLGGGSSTPAPQAPSAVAAANTNAADAGAAQVSLATATATGPRNRKGAVHNPFKAPPAAKTADATSTATAATPTQSTATPLSGGTPTVTPAGQSTPSTTTTTPGTTTTTKTATPRLASRRVYRVAVRFGEAGDEKTLHDALRLSALPSTAKPAVLFLGVLVDGRTAVFIVNSGAQATGDGWCRPRANSCHILAMQAGDSEMLELATGTAGIVQYRLHVAKVVRRTAKTRTVAARSHARVSKSGRELLRAAIAQDVPGTGDFRFDRAIGLLLPL